jgi:outer membrane protein assembly factor BamB
MMMRLLLLLAAALVAQPPAIPSSPLVFGVFTARFGADGAFSLQGAGWPSLGGTWRVNGKEIEVVAAPPPRGCDDKAGRYRFTTDGTRVTLDVVEDACVPRRMILDRSSWRPPEQAPKIPERRLVRTAAPRPPRILAATSARGSWPSFRGSSAAGIADGSRLPDSWDGSAGTNILWRTPIPGLAHSSPVVWGDRIFVTSAVSSRADATFRPGLYGDGDASEDRSRHRWMIYAIDKRTGKIAWEAVAHEGEPRNKRHIKSTYASASPATDGRIVVAWFGSEGIHAYDVKGNFLWKVDLGRVDMGAYDIPTYEWGPASSPIIWNGLVIVQCDTQADSFLLALKAETGETVWRTPREELPSWGTPTVAETASGPQVLTNASNFIRGYDARTGRQLWQLGGSSKITAPTPLFAGGLFVIASGRGPERPIFAVRPEARGDITLQAGATSNDAVAWSKVQRGSYMPTPLAYQGILYVLANNGLFDAYDLKTGEEIYRQRLAPVGNGFSASPIAADGKIYLSNEDGDMLVVAAGREFTLLSTNPMGELLMATPALSDGVMYVRTSKSLFAVGRRP